MMRAGETVMRGKHTLFSVAAVLLILSSPVFAYRQLIDLGTLGGTSSWASSINDKAQIVGWAYDITGNQRASVFDATGNGANINLGTLGASSNTSSASCINNKGMIVGNITNSAGFTACLFDSTGNGANIDLKSLSSLYPQSSTYSINDSGIIVGYALDKNNGTCAVIFDNTGGGASKDLANHNIPYQSYSSCAYSINDDGKIVGRAIARNSGLGYSQHACLFDETGGGANIDLAKLNSYGSQAGCINNNDQIVGCYFDNRNNEKAYLFDNTGSGANIFLGTLGGTGSSAFSINDIGQIVGWADMPGQIFPHACLFDPSGQGANIDLNTLVKVPFGWELTYASSINNSGWIVGAMMNNNGDFHAFLLTPEPATLVLFGLGGLILRRRK
jgi:uncharacterized membrane protein